MTSVTVGERALLAVTVALILAALVLPAEVVETLIIAEVVVLGVTGLAAGIYIWRVNRKLIRSASEYLWLLVRRNMRVAFALAMLAALSLAVAIPRAFDWESVVQRPWGTLWLVSAINLFAVGLLDDAMIMRSDR